MPQANLTLLDPVFTTATVTSNHGHYMFGTLYSVGPDGQPHPQMAAGHTISDEGAVARGDDGCGDGAGWTVVRQDGVPLFY